MLGLDTDYYREVSAIVVYPTTIMSRGEYAGPVRGHGDRRCRAGAGSGARPAGCDPHRVGRGARCGAPSRPRPQRRVPRVRAQARHARRRHRRHSPASEGAAGPLGRGVHRGVRSAAAGAGRPRSTRTAARRSPSSSRSRPKPSSTPRSRVRDHTSPTVRWYEGSGTWIAAFYNQDPVGGIPHRRTVRLEPLGRVLGIVGRGPRRSNTESAEIPPGNSWEENGSLVGHPFPAYPAGRRLRGPAVAHPRARLPLDERPTGRSQRGAAGAGRRGRRVPARPVRGDRGAGRRSPARAGRAADGLGQERGLLRGDACCARGARARRCSSLPCSA